MAMDYKRGDVIVPQFCRNVFILRKGIRFRIDPVPWTGVIKSTKYRHIRGFKAKLTADMQWMPWQEDTEKPIIFRNANATDLYDPDLFCESIERNFTCSWKQRKRRRQWNR